MGFGITHAHIVLNHKGIVAHAYKANKHKTDKIKLIFFKPFHGGGYDAILNFLFENSVIKRNGRHRAHTSSIESRIAFTYAFVIFGKGKGHMAFTIGKDKTGKLNAVQKALNNHLFACCTKFFVGQHIDKRRFCFFELMDDEYTFSCSKPIGL